MSAAEPKLSFRRQLAERTRPSHENTERVVDGLDIFSSDGSYLDWLKSQFILHDHFLDAGVTGLEALHIAPNIHELLGAIRDDIAHLDGAANDGAHLDGAASGGVGSRYVARDRSSAVGVAYVLVGSGLGASVLHKRALASPNPLVGSLAFLDLAQRLAASGWRQFVSQLEVCAAGSDEHPPLSIDSACESAIEVFNFFADTLREKSPLETSPLEGAVQTHSTPNTKVSLRS